MEVFAVIAMPLVCFYFDAFFLMSAATLPLMASLFRRIPRVIYFIFDYAAAASLR